MKRARTNFMDSLARIGGLKTVIAVLALSLLFLLLLGWWVSTYFLGGLASRPVATASPLSATCIPALPATCVPAQPATPVPAPTEAPEEGVCGIEYVLGTEDTLSPYVSNQVMVRESMVSALRAHDLDAFCDSYFEFRRVGKEESFVSVMPEGVELVLDEKDGWMLRILMIDWFLIPDLVQLSELCGGEEG